MRCLYRNSTNISVLPRKLPAELAKDVRYADLNEIMYYVEKEKDDE